jgi:hypothetical protein
MPRGFKKKVVKGGRRCVKIYPAKHPRQRR